MDAPQEEQDWAQSCKARHRALYSELDTLLRALVRFFEPGLHQDSPTKDFLPELALLRDGILRCLSILECIIPEQRRNAYWLRRYAQQRLLEAPQRQHLREWMLQQDSLEKSLYLLYDTFINIKEVVAELLRGEALSYGSFMGAGQLLERQIRANRFLNPFRAELDPQLDVIENPELTAIVKGLKEPPVRRFVSRVFILLWRFLRWLSHVELATQREVALNAALLVLYMLKVETGLFVQFLRKASRDLPQELEECAQSLAYQFSMEHRRVFEQELRGVLSKGPARRRGQIENAQGILRNLTEQAVIQVAQLFRPSLRGEDIFESFTTKLEQSLKLREDIEALRRLLGRLTAGDAGERPRVLQALRDFMRYFQSFTFRLLRHDDYEEFSSFFNLLQSAMARGDMDRLLAHAEHFEVFLQTTLGHIAQRAELRGRALDEGKVEGLLRQYLD